MSAPTKTPRTASLARFVLGAIVPVLWCSVAGSSFAAPSGSPEGAAAPSGKSVNQQRCDRAVKVAGPAPGANQGSELRTRKNRWQPVVEAAARDQFVVAKQDVEMAINWDNTKRLKRSVPAGEPLLLFSCFLPDDPKNGTATVITLDGVFEKKLPIASLDLSPTSFTWNAPVLESKLSAYDLAKEAHADDKQAVAGWKELYKKYSECRIQATGQCMAAEKRIAQGPPRVDLEEAKAKACRAASDKVFDGCLGNGGRAKFDRLSADVNALSLKRDAAWDAAMHAKLK